MAVPSKTARLLIERMKNCRQSGTDLDSFKMATGPVDT
jgi:hypothetical protein